MPSQTNPTESGPTSTSLFDMLDAVASMLTNNSPPAVINAVSTNEMRKKEVFVMAAVPSSAQRERGRTGVPLTFRLPPERKSCGPRPDCVEHRSAGTCLSNSRTYVFMGRIRRGQRA